MNTFNLNYHPIFKKLVFEQTRFELLILWVIFFCYTISMGLIFQKLIVPNVNSLHAVGSSMTNDATFFHGVAVSLAEQINNHGWASWKLFPTPNAAGHVSILAVLYVLFGVDPSLVIPLNAFFHASGGVLIYLIAAEVNGDKQVARYAGLFAAMAFVLFPSAMNWYGQIHKDGYLIFGNLLILLVCLKVMRSDLKPSNFLSFFALIMLGILIVAVIRPYILKVLIIVIIVTLGMMIFKKFLPFSKSRIVFFLLTLLVMLISLKVIYQSDGKELAGSGYMSATVTTQGSFKGWKWDKSEFIPSYIDIQFRGLASTRLALLSYGQEVKAGSMTDLSTAPNSTFEVITYIPRALQIAVLAPFPNTWLTSLKPTRLVAALEMLVIYLSLFGIIYLIKKEFNYSILFVLIFSTAFLVVYGISVANIGSLYRVRYCYEMLLLMLGISGWFLYFKNTGLLQKIINKNSATFYELSNSLVKNNTQSNKTENFNNVSSPNLQRKQVIGSAVLVMILTLLGFAGFFLRDVLMAQFFGINAKLDIFYIAMMAPMFLVNVLCIPLGSALVISLHQIKGESKRSLQLFISNFSLTACAWSLVICVLIYFLTPKLLQLTGFSTLAYTHHVMSIFILGLLIFMMSGLVIISNSIHFAHGNYVLPNALQLVVPVIAIMSLFIFGIQYGVVAVMIGMLIGQLLNLLFLQLSLNRYQLSIAPRYNQQSAEKSKQLWREYFPLAAIALFTGITVPINIILAANLSEGAVTVFNLGSKVVLSILALLTTVMTSVLLPYFSHLLNTEGRVSARRELSFFLLVSTAFSIPISVLIFLSADSVANIILFNSNVRIEDLTNISRIIKFGIIQLPFWVSNIILLKFSNATRNNKIIIFTTLIGLAINILLSMILMPKLDVAGISLAASLAVVLSSMILLVYALVKHELIFLDFVVIFLNWLLFTALILSVHFVSLPSITIVIFTYIFLIAVYFSNKKIYRNTENINA